MIDYRSTEGLVVVATHGHGIFSSNLTDVREIAVEDLSTMKLNSLVIYPNPATTGCTIKYSLNKSKRDRLELLNEVSEAVRVSKDAFRKQQDMKFSSREKIRNPGYITFV